MNEQLWSLAFSQLDELRRQAHIARLVRLLEPERVPLFDQLLLLTGSWLIRLGRRLQRASHQTQRLSQSRA
jgi:hypothetical protein